HVGTFTDWETAALVAPAFSARDSHSLTLVDVDGDGRADACGRSQSGLTCALSNGAQLHAPGDPQGDFADSHGWSGRPDITALAVGRRTQPSDRLSNQVARENE